MKCISAMESVLMRVELTVVLPYQYSPVLNACTHMHTHTLATLLYNGDVMVITL